MASNINSSHLVAWLLQILRSGSAVVYSLFIVAPIVCGGGGVLFCCTVLCGLSTFLTVLLGNSELIALLVLSS